ncbi:hypothetical protein NEDG_01753 [Nematocida displodere]|uniref:Sm domain-containing protein n=1 Tax=Nematocida displodere TaxID=1805483 RepID=A0A177EFI1_9MICR|nr:hypothetical protein NEDG_01753 [Nematocida displodere]
MHPIDWAIAQVGKNVRIVLRGGKVYTGMLLGYDGNVNLVMDHLTLANTNEYIGRSILSGVTVAYIEGLG